MTLIKSDNLNIFEFDIRGHFLHQIKIQNAAVNDLVWLIPEPWNEHDENAILILDKDGDEIGHVPSEICSEILGYFESGNSQYCAQISKIEVSKSNEILPYVTLYISRRYEDLPFKQESTFSLQTTLEENGEFSYSIKDNRNKINEISYNKYYFLTLAIFAIIMLIIIIGTIKNKH